MKLQTNIPLKPQAHNAIDYNAKILLIGSCFSEHIGKKFSHFKFQNTSNPFGILFHPKAIETLITNALTKKNYTAEDLVFQNDQWHCYDAHSKLSNISKEHLLHNLNSNLEATTQRLTEASHIIITLGTAWIYELIETKKSVANCHRIPQNQFTKRILSIEEITNSLETIVKFIKSINTRASIIFTVSPVRHTKDGFIENTQSKAHLISAIHKVLASTEKSKNLNYFPSYEIMMDELRDYRFYNADMLHPNQIAINYIWEKFKMVWITSNASKTMETVDDIQKGIHHKPFNPDSEAHLKFLQQLNQKMSILQTQFPHITFK